MVSALRSGIGWASARSNERMNDRVDIRNHILVIKQHYINGQKLAGHIPRYAWAIHMRRAVKNSLKCVLL